MADKQINCLAVDDEPPALEIIKTYAAAIPALRLVSTAVNAVEALQIMNSERIDLLFLDIQMPFLQGTDFLRSLDNPPKVIFTSAHRKFALEGFELEAVDYLLKPISFDRFLKSVKKFIHSPSAGTAATTEAVPAPGSHILVRVDRQNVNIPLNEILFAESVRDYVKLILRDRSLIVKTSISALQEMLPADQFIRVHRSFIVASRAVSGFEPETIRIGDYLVPVSRSYRHEAEKALKKN